MSDSFPKTYKEMLKQVVEQAKRFRATPIVDDEFPLARDRFDTLVDAAHTMLHMPDPADPPLSLRIVPHSGVVQGGACILLNGTEGHHAYLHTDGVWRQSCVGPLGMTGHWSSPEQAQAGLNMWMRLNSLYDTKYSTRGNPKTVKRRNPEVWTFGPVVAKKVLKTAKQD